MSNKTQQPGCESLRDAFAAAALTGLLAQGDDGSFSEASYARAAYRWADAMLSERANRQGILNSCPTASAGSDVFDSQTANTHGATLTDAEREAVRSAVAEFAALAEDHQSQADESRAVTLRGLLERLGVTEPLPKETRA